MKKSKFQQLKDYAVSIGICRSCLRREAMKGRTRCSKCINTGAKASQRRRENPLNCSRCGHAKIDLSFKCCENCRK